MANTCLRSLIFKVTCLYQIITVKNFSHQLFAFVDGVVTSIHKQKQENLNQKGRCRQR